MAKRPSLAETMRQAVASEVPAEDTPPTKPRMVKKPSAPSKKQVPLPPEQPVSYYAATRAGKKKVTASLTPDAHKQLRQLGLDRDMTTEALLAEALNDLFKKYGKKTLA